MRKKIHRPGCAPSSLGANLLLATGCGCAPKVLKLLEPTLEHLRENGRFLPEKMNAPSHDPSGLSETSDLSHL
jgi:hypothetical protein